MTSATTRRRRSILIAVMVMVWATLTLGFRFGVIPSFAATLAGAAIIAGGFLAARSVATPQPPPPDPGELRKVKIGYRCTICGTEVRMTVATHQDPDPPRHCQEEMELVAPIE